MVDLEYLIQFLDHLYLTLEVVEVLLTEVDQAIKELVDLA
jgi:hypothetical protein